MDNNTIFYAYYGSIKREHIIRNQSESKIWEIVNITDPIRNARSDRSTIFPSQARHLQIIHLINRIQTVEVYLQKLK